MVVVGGVESENSVCQCPLLQFVSGYVRLLRHSTLEGRDVELDNSYSATFKLFSLFQFMSVRLHQVMSCYVRFCHVTSVYVGGTGRGARQLRLFSV